jgi:hypothetical protein
MPRLQQQKGLDSRNPQKTFSPKLFVVPKNFLGIKNGFKRSLGVEKFLGDFLLFRGYVWHHIFTSSIGV